MTQSLNVGVSGVWKPSKPYVGVSGVWKPVQAAFVGVGGVWKQFYTAALTFITAGLWTDNGDGTFTASFGVTVSNGQAPYTYAWTNHGSTSPVFGTSNGFSVDFAGPGTPTSQVMDCKVTDANGLTGIAVCTANYP